MKKSEKRKLLLNLKNKLATYMLISGLAGSTLLTGCSNEIKEEDKLKVESVYGLDSEEMEILTYIELSNQLHDLKLDKYNIELDTNVTLDTPENIQLKIDDMDIKYLKEQEENVNFYLRSYGYNIAKDASLSALKSYVKETLGLSQLDDIELRITTSGEETFSVGAIVEGNYISLDNSLDNIATEAVQNYLITNVEPYEDSNKKDNHKYNKKRNQIICNTLVESSKLETQVKERDLANPKLIRKLQRK